MCSMAKKEPKHALRLFLFVIYVVQLFFLNFRPHLQGIVIGDNLHEMSKLFSWENKKIISK